MRLTDVAPNNTGDVSNCCSAEGAEPEGKAFDLSINLGSSRYPWAQALGRDWKNEIANTNRQISFTP